MTADAVISDAPRTPRGKGRQGGAPNQAAPIYLAAKGERFYPDRATGGLRQRESGSSFSARQRNS